MVLEGLTLHGRSSLLCPWREEHHIDLVSVVWPHFSTSFWPGYSTVEIIKHGINRKVAIHRKSRALNVVNTAQVGSFIHSKAACYIKESKSRTGGNDVVPEDACLHALLLHIVRSPASCFVIGTVPTPTSFMCAPGFLSDLDEPILPIYAADNTLVNGLMWLALAIELPELELPS